MAVSEILNKLRNKAEISDEELNELQMHIDVLERADLRARTHHDTTTHHHTSALELEDIATIMSRRRP